MSALVVKLRAPAWRELAKCMARRHLNQVVQPSVTSDLGIKHGESKSNEVEPPKTFGDSFNKAAYQLTDAQQLLQKKHGHPRDGKMSFEAEEHKYFYEGTPLKFSVTEVVGMCGQRFDPDHSIAMMKAGSRWPRAEYMTRGGVAWSDAQIKAFWDNMGMHARNRGTWMHYNIERHWNELPPLDQEPEMPKFLQFREEILDAAGVVPWRTEWRVCDPAVSVGGSIDFVGRLPDGSYCIVDWKRSKLKVHPGWAVKWMKEPLSHLQETRTTEYFLQLNIYRRILQDVYGLPVSRMVLAAFHPTESKYKAVDVPIMEKETDLLMQHAVELGKQNVRVVVEEEDRA